MNERVVLDPDVQHGMPVIRGTKVSIATIIGELAAGTGMEGVARRHHLADEDISAALAYAAELIEERHLEILRKGLGNLNRGVTISPKVHHGQPVVRGTRVPVWVLLEGIASGMEKREIARQYHVTDEDVSAALMFAAELMKVQDFHRLAVTSE